MRPMSTSIQVRDVLCTVRFPAVQSGAAISCFAGRAIAVSREQSLLLLLQLDRVRFMVMRDSFW